MQWLADSMIPYLGVYKDKGTVGWRNDFGSRFWRTGVLSIGLFLTYAA